MRTTINEASVIIHLLNDFNKSPILNANITCNGKNIPFIKKQTGHYVFLNMQRAKYQFNISAFGFGEKSLEVDLTEANASQRVHVIRLNYKIDHYNIANVRKIVFSLKQKNRPVANKEVKLRLDTKVPQLRVIEPMMKNSKEVTLNSSFNARFLFQSFNYDKKTNLELLFNSYDHENGCYINEEPFKAKIAADGLLSPVWSFVTDENGVFILPVDNTFFQSNKLDFTVFVGRKSLSIMADMTEDTLYKDVNI